jgi:hypothetical protein
MRTKAPETVETRVIRWQLLAKGRANVGPGEWSVLAVPGRSWHRVSRSQPELRKSQRSGLLQVWLTALTARTSCQVALIADRVARCVRVFDLPVPSAPE